MARASLYRRLKNRMLRRIRRAKPQLYLGGLLIVGLVLILALMSSRADRPAVANSLTYSGSSDIRWLPSNVQRWQPQIEHFAQAYNVNADLLAIIMTLESSGDPNATSPVGAQGLMQVMPATANDIARKHLLAPRQQFDLYDPATNIEFGAAYINYLRNIYDGDRDDDTDQVRVVAAGYNGGTGAANRLLRNEAGRAGENVRYAESAATLWKARANLTMPLIVQ